MIAICIGQAWALGQSWPGLERVRRARAEWRSVEAVREAMRILEDFRSACRVLLVRSLGLAMTLKARSWGELPILHNSVSAGLARVVGEESIADGRLGTDSGRSPIGELRNISARTPGRT
jgi:hypothetical protein